MTEYWVSNARKFCEFCKCWLADNKVSISFHEGGKRHKESVQKHISQLSKKSAKDYKQKEKVDDDIKKMEKAAMAAYLKDVENNADITSQELNSMLGRDKVPLPKPSSSQEKPKAPLLWSEVRADDGTVYFWNTQTNETVWDPPDEYISLAQQEEQKLKEKESDKSKERLDKQRQKEAGKEKKALAAREKMKERAVRAPARSAEAPAQPCGPSLRAPDPYGSWTPVPQQIKEEIDLQLPKLERVQAQVPVAVVPETIQFKERKLESLGEGPVDFKKRKLNSNFRKNMRQKTDDD